MMNHATILYPLFALAAWTQLVLNLIPLVRVRAALRREVSAGDFRYGESERVPPHVSIPNRNYMNLLELPLLFYVICIIIYITRSTAPSALTLAWAYVALRIVHSLIHLSYNNVIHRLSVFALSNIVLIALWIFAGLQLSKI